MQKVFKSCSGNGRTRPIAVSCPLTRSIVTPSGKTIMVDRRNRLSRVVVRRELSYRGQKCTISNAFIGVASYGALGHVPLLDFQQFIFGTLLRSCIKCHCHISFLCPMSSGFFVQQLSKLSLLFFFHFTGKHEKGANFLKHSVFVFSHFMRVARISSMSSVPRT